MLQSLAEGTKEGIGSAISAGSQIQRLSPEQKSRMKELERNQALGLLGLDQGQQQQILSQQLQPVQTSLREAMDRQAQQQQIQDIGQGSAFRGQQALLETGQQQASQAVQRGQQTIAQLDELEKARQLSELDQYQKQRQTNKRAMAEVAQGLIGGGATAAAGMVAADDATKQIRLREEALRAAVKAADIEVVDEAIGVQGKAKSSKEFSGKYINALTNMFAPRLPPASDTQEGSNTNTVLENLENLYKSPITGNLMTNESNEMSGGESLEDYLYNREIGKRLLGQPIITTQEEYNAANVPAAVPIANVSPALTTQQQQQILAATLMGTPLLGNIVTPQTTALNIATGGQQPVQPPVQPLVQQSVQQLQVGSFIPNVGDNGYVIKEIGPNGEVTKIAFKAGSTEYGTLVRSNLEPSVQGAFEEFDRKVKALQAAGN